MFSTPKMTPKKRQNGDSNEDGKEANEYENESPNPADETTEMTPRSMISDLVNQVEKLQERDMKYKSELQQLKRYFEFEFIGHVYILGISIWTCNSLC